VDPCELAISTGATWVGRGFSGDVKFLADLTARAIAHNGFSFLNVISPCVTWRGDDQFKMLKQKLAYLPEDHDPTRRLNAVPYTREKDVVTTGVLYCKQEPSLVERLEDVKQRAMAGQAEPTTREILETFYPQL
jgi:2-oxoglutarate ferredoxin oxidoreductase subunit beta